MIDAQEGYPVNDPETRSDKQTSNMKAAALLTWLGLGANLVSLAGPLSWLWCNPLPNGNNCYELALHNWLALSVCDRGQLYTSTDYELWEPYDTGTRYALRGIAFFKDKIVLTGENGTILYAPIGKWENFTLISLGTTDWLESIAVGNGVAVAVGDNGAIYTSADGLSWVRRPQAFTTWLRSVAFGNGTFVTVGENGFAATSANGISWTRRSTGTTADLNKVAWLTNRFIAVGSGGVILGSATGASWSVITGAGITNDLYFVAGYYPATSGSSPIILVGGNDELRLFADGSWWDQTSSAKVFPAPKWDYYTAFWDGAAFLVGGSAGLLIEGFKPTTDSDYVWVERSESLRPWLWDVSRIGSTFVAVGNYGSIMTSTDGIQWTVEVVPDEAKDTVLLGVGGRENAFIAAGSAGTLLMSTNAVVWATASVPAVTNDLQGVTFWNGQFFVTGGGGKVISSPDGLSWTVRAELGSMFLSGIAGSSDRLVVCGQQGAIFTSVDGNSWVRVQSGTTNWLYRVRFIGGMWFAVGQNGTILASPDGEKWSTQASNTSNWLTDICQFNGNLYAVGTQGTVLVSTNKATWGTERTITQKSLFGVVSDSHQLVAVGVEGVILRGQTGPLIILDYRRSAPTNTFAFSSLPGRSLLVQSCEVIPNWSDTAVLKVLDNRGLLLHVGVSTNSPPHELFRAMIPSQTRF